jgi:hypothetical protein
MTIARLRDTAFLSASPTFTRSKSVPKPRDTILGCAVITTIEHALLLKAMPHYSCPAMLACRRQCVDRAFKAVERMGLAIHCDLKSLVIVIAASFACRHLNLLRTAWAELPLLPATFESERADRQHVPENRKTSAPHAIIQVSPMGAGPESMHRSSTSLNAPIAVNCAARMPFASMNVFGHAPALHRQFRGITAAVRCPFAIIQSRGTSGFRSAVTTSLRFPRPGLALAKSMTLRGARAMR